MTSSNGAHSPDSIETFLPAGLEDGHHVLLILRRWSVLPLRLVVGFGFAAHGYAKIVSGPAHFADTLHALGVPVPAIMAWATIGLELLGGIAVFAGAWVPLFSVPLAAILIVAALTVHLPYGFTSIKLRGVTSDGLQFGPPGYETNLLYLAALATLVFGGSGPLALDDLIGGRKSRASTRQDALNE